MSIDISSAIPVINPIEIRINKEEDSQIVKAVEESSESRDSELQMNREGSAWIIRDNSAGVGDTYTTRGELIRESRSLSGSGNKNLSIDMRI